MRTFNISPARRFRIRVTEVKEQTSPEPQDDHLYAIAGWFSKEASMIPTRFSRKLKLPSTAQIKHEVLVGWLADQTAKEDLNRNRPRKRMRRRRALPQWTSGRKERGRRPKIPPCLMLDTKSPDHIGGRARSDLLEVGALNERPILSPAIDKMKTPTRTVVGKTQIP